jgi:hypothetical protein
MRLVLPLLLALVLVPAALAADPHVQTIAGVVTANSGSSLTVSTTGRSVTCMVTGTTAQAAIARWGTGARAAMACRQVGDTLTLARLIRLGATDAKRSGGGTTTAPPATTTTAAPVKTEIHQAIGVVTALSSDGVTVTATSGEPLHCRITQAADSTAAAHKLSLGAHVGIVCRADGGSFVLSGATSAG